MKKHLLSGLLLCAGLAIAGCGGTTDSGKDAADEDKTAQTETTTGDPAAKSEGTMTYQEYVDAEVDTPVVIEAFVQDKQAWNDGKATLYAADPDGAYFIYNANIPQEVYDQLTPGTKIKVTGYKTEWSGEQEVAEGADVEVLTDATYIAPAKDITALLGSEELINDQNKLVAINGMTVEPYNEGSEEVYSYNFDGSGQEGDDLYFKVSKDGQVYTFTVESSLDDANSDVYQAVKNLQAGQNVNLEGFLYWYEGANPHITSVTVVE